MLRAYFRPQRRARSLFHMGLRVGAYRVTLLHLFVGRQPRRAGASAVPAAPPVLRVFNRPLLGYRDITQGDKGAARN